MLLKEAEEKAAAIQKARLIATNQKLLKASYMQIIAGAVFQVVDGGILVHVHAKSDGTFKGTGNKKEQNIEFRDRWLIFVSCDNNSLVDGKGFTGEVWADGTYAYATAIGSGKTIPKYTTNPKDIIKR